MGDVLAGGAAGGFDLGQGGYKRACAHYTRSDPSTSIRSINF